MDNVLTFVLAIGKCKKIYPLSKERSKAAIPFGSKYRIIDFVLSNFINSEMYKIKLLTQYRSETLTRHLSLAWNMSNILRHYIDSVPPQMKTGNNLYSGSAEAIFQNLNFLYDEKFSRVCIFDTNHIFKMDVKQFLNFHDQKRADISIVTVPVPIKNASDYTIVNVDDNFQVIEIEKHPKNPKHIPGNRSMALGTIGSSVFNKDVLIESVTNCNNFSYKKNYSINKDIIPELINSYRVFAYNLYDNVIPGMSEDERKYCIRVNSLDTYWEANMDLVSISPKLNIYNALWPIRTHINPLPPVKFVFSNLSKGRIGMSTNSLISEGCIISGGKVNNSILSPNVRVNSFSDVEESILFEGVEVGRYAKVKRAIIDKNVKIPPGMKIGFDLEKDRKRFHVTPSGIVVIPKNSVFDLIDNDKRVNITKNIMRIFDDLVNIDTNEQKKSLVLN